jgi:hypothetical protein
MGTDSNESSPGELDINLNQGLSMGDENIVGTDTNDNI